MLEFFGCILNTGVLACPFLFPLAILIFVKRPKFRFTWKPQQLFVLLFFVLYAFSLLLFVAHAYATQPGVQEFFSAFWGVPVVLTTWCFAAYMAQALSCVALLFALNWGVVRQLNPKLAGTKPTETTARDSDQAVDAVEALQEKSNRNEKA